MPFPFPTPAEAAQARNSAGFFDRLGSTVLHKLPYVGPLYNAGSTIAHLVQGTQGQYGPPTSIAGKILALLSGNSTNAPRAIPVGAGAAPGAQGAPSGFVNAYPTAFGNFNQLPGEISAGGPVAGFDSKNGATVYNPRGVIPNAAPPSPAFSPTGIQQRFPGSAIGPLNGIANPYNPASTHGTPNSVFTGISGPAADFLASVRARNIA